MTEDPLQIAAGLRSADPGQRALAAERLCRLTTAAAPAAVDLVGACRDPAEEVRQWAGAALEDLGPPLASDVPALTKLLADDNHDVVYWAATLLGRCGPVACSAVDELKSLAADHRAPTIRRRAAWALGQIVAD